MNSEKISEDNIPIDIKEVLNIEIDNTNCFGHFMPNYRKNNKENEE